MRNLTYEIVCNLCQEKGVRSVYWGESHRTWWDRFREHQDALANKNTDYAIVKHMAIHHPGSTPDYSYRANRSWKTSLERQLGDALLI